MQITTMTSELLEKWTNAVAIDLEGEDGSLYLATVLSMAEIAFLKSRAQTEHHKTLIKDAETMQASLARNGKQIRIS